VPLDILGLSRKTLDSFNAFVDLGLTDSSSLIRRSCVRHAMLTENGLVPPQARRLQLQVRTQSSFSNTWAVLLSIQLGILAGNFN
jgi:hypothetical protein